MKIIQINNIFPYGSTGKITLDLHNGYLERGLNSIVLYAHGDKSGDKCFKICSKFYTKIQALRSRISGIVYGGCILSTRKIIKIISKEKPDIVHLHCINGNFVNIFKLIKWLKNNQVNTVITNHAEFYYTGNCAHSFECTKYLSGCGYCPMLKEDLKSWFFDRTKKSWNKMKKAFNGFSTVKVCSVSPWLFERSKNSIILKEHENLVVFNGVDTKIFHYKESQKVSSIKNILHVTAHFSSSKTDLKGGIHVINLAKRLPDYTFFVVGKYDLDGEIPKNIKLLGEIKDQNQLASLYSQANLSLLTSRRETFSMTTIESLCCGTPVVGFKAGGPESISIPKYSTFVEYANIEQLIKAIRTFELDGFDKREVSNEASKIYSKDKMVENYLNVYRSFENFYEGAKK